MPEDEPAMRVMSIFDEESVSIAGGAVDWVPVRRRLGIRAFGINAYRAARAGDCVIEEHVESPGQEELYVVMAGRARISVDGETLDCGVGTGVFVPRPDLSRSGIALEDGTVVLAVGGWPDRPYRSLPWEPIYLAQESLRSGDWAKAAETLEREAGDSRENPNVMYRLACCYARIGDDESALSELRGAIGTNPAMAEKARLDEHFTALRENPRWTDAVESPGSEAR